MRLAPSVACALATSSCLAPLTAPPIPAIPPASSVVWTVSEGEAIRSIEEWSVDDRRPPLSLREGEAVELLYYGCPKENLEVDMLAPGACLPSTDARFRWQIGEAEWTRVGPLESSITLCDPDPCQGLVADELIDEQNAANGPLDYVRSAALVAGSEAGPAVLLSIGNRTSVRFVLVRPGAPLIAFPEATADWDYGAGLWAGDGTIWSAGASGLFRGELHFEQETVRLTLRPVITSTTSLATLAGLHISLAPVATEPVELLMVSDSGAVARWSDTEVAFLKLGRPTGPNGTSNQVRADIAALSGRAGWALIGPVAPLFDENKRNWTPRGYVEYSDGIIGPDLPLVGVVGAANHPDFGTLMLTETGDLYEPGALGPRPAGFVSEVTGTLRGIRAFRDHFVIVPERGPVGHLKPLETGGRILCRGSVVTSDRAFDVIAADDILIEVGQHAQVRFLTTKRPCAIGL